MAKRAGSPDQSKEKPLSDSVDPDPEFHVRFLLENFMHGLHELRVPAIDLGTPEAARNAIATLDELLETIGKSRRRIAAVRTLLGGQEGISPSSAGQTLDLRRMPASRR